MQAGLAQRHYQTASLFSDGEKRRDTEWNTSLSLWHRALHFGGITPRLTVAYYRNNSNDAFYEYDKLRTFIEFNKQLDCGAFFVNDIYFVSLLFYFAKRFISVFEN